MAKRKKNEVTLEELLREIESKGEVPAPKRTAGAWDKGHHYLELKNEILKRLHNLESYARATNRGKGPFFYYATALLQLTNGLRASEAVIAMYKWLKEGKQMFFIQALKYNNPRPVCVPEELIQYYGLLRECLTYLLFRFAELKKIINNYMHFIGRRLVNTHTLRYAFIRYAVEQGLNATRIALIIGHKKLNTTMHYAQGYQAIDDLRALVYGLKIRKLEED
jgi:hypothetical protein